MSNEFSVNLKSLCAERGSIAQVCREIGINRQQFNRYLSGAGMPSAHNMRRIANYFDLMEADLFLAHGEFARKHMDRGHLSDRSPMEPLARAFKDQKKSLRRFLGFYHVHFCTPSWEGKVMRSLVWLYEENGYVLTRTVERVDASDDSIRHKARYDGWVAFRGSRIYVLELERGDSGSLVESIIFPAFRQQLGYLRGMTFGVAWRPRLTPYSSRTIWKRISERVTPREAIDACGVLALDSLQLDPTVREFLGAGASADKESGPMQDFF